MYPECGWMMFTPSETLPDSVVIFSWLGALHLLPYLLVVPVHECTTDNNIIVPRDEMNIQSQSS